jgi:membrane fusion protein, multidrug efflux system
MFRPADAADLGGQKMSTLMSTLTPTPPVSDANAPAAPPASRGQAAFVPPVAAGAPKTAGRRRVALFGLVGLAAAAIAGWAYLPGLYAVDTDDAYVQTDIVSVVPKVSGYVVALHVTDNTAFKAGQLLVELDPRDYQAAVDGATADLRGAEAAKANVEAQSAEQDRLIAAAQAAVDGDVATLAFAEKQLTRYHDLAANGSGTGQRFEQAESDDGTRKAALGRDQANLQAAQAHMAVLKSQVQQADAAIARQQASLAQAELNLSHTRIYAEASGSVANRTVQLGNFVQPGQTLFSAVPEEEYVVANYKETQLDRMRVGQPVRIFVDAFPDLTLRGRVDSFQRGTGSTFALLPPENATGNFIKVVQRVPVKITFDDPAEVARRVSPGMSVRAIVTVAQWPRWLSWLM